MLGKFGVQPAVDHTPYIVGGLLLAVLWAFLCYRLAKKKGREPGVAAMLGLLFGIFALIGYAIVKPKATHHAVFVDPKDNLYWCEVCGQHTYNRGQAVTHGDGHEPGLKTWSTRPPTSPPPSSVTHDPPARPDL